MDFYCLNKSVSLSYFQVDKEKGLTSSRAKDNLIKFGKNILSERKKTSFFSSLFGALKEPMMLILIFSFVLAFGTSLGEYLKTGKASFSECVGILLAIILSISVTLIMESSSERAFIALKKIQNTASVKVLRDGKISYIKKEDVALGDIILIESGDKIVADGRLIESDSLYVDESALTGESEPVLKNADAVLDKNTPLSMHVNCVYSGTFVSSGVGKMIAFGTGDKTEIGTIASELKRKKEVKSPLEQKLAKLGKTVTLVGCIISALVFIISIIRAHFSANLTFDGIKDAFISCIILIVAAVPEGLPTIVAVMLALNMIKLAKENALIKKMIATETAGAVSVICSDKTGTITLNKMSISSVFNERGKEIFSIKEIDNLYLNFILNSTAELDFNGSKKRMGNATECALLEYLFLKNKNFDYKKVRKEYKREILVPFKSENKYMITSVFNKDRSIQFIKGAPEKVLDFCALNIEEKEKLLQNMKKRQERAERVICFGHKENEENFIFDGFVSMVDPIRSEVKEAILSCKSAGIKVKILTGDNAFTAFAIAKKLGIVTKTEEVKSGDEIEGLTEEQLKEVLKETVVIARSTPLVKLKVVKALKSLGEVVAVTGDGINDAPAIKQADVGIVMGKTGSDITKEAADVLLLDDSFSTLVKAVKFGRSVYKNLQRFIVFQISVNVSALLIVTVSAILGREAPFSTLQMLWINLIMDGPPALTLGLTAKDGNLMKEKPVKRNQSIVSKKMFAIILFNGIFTGSVVLAQIFTNFLGANVMEKNSSVFTLFVIFQLFNAFNSVELGSKSIFRGFLKNKIMLLTFLAVFVLQIVIVSISGGMRIGLWLKILLTASSVIFISEGYKLLYRNVLRAKTKKPSVNKNYYGA